MGNNHKERAEMGYMELFKLDIDNQRLNDYHSRVTIERGSKNYMRQPAFILGLITSLVLLVPALCCPSASAYRKGDFPGIGNKADWQRANDVYNAALDLDDAHNYEAEAVKLMEAINLYPYEAVYWDKLGICLKRQNKLSQAETAFRNQLV